MGASVDWSVGYARQADADFNTFQLLQQLNETSVPQCHKLQFLQMACEKLVKAYLCGTGTDPSKLDSSHAYVAKTLPVVLRQQAIYVNFTGGKAKAALNHAKRLAQEIEVLAPAVKRDGQRPDNCEYPWEDDNAVVRTPLDWAFPLSDFVVQPAGCTILKLIRGAIDQLLL